MGRNAQTPGFRRSVRSGYCLGLGLLWVGCLVAGEPIDPEREAVTLAVDGEYRQAGDILMDLLGTSPDHPRWLYLLGMCRYFEGDRTAARDLLQRAVDGDAPFPEAYVWLARLLRQEGDVPAARTVAARGLERFPRHVKLVNLLSAGLEEEQRP
jgi:tetratricopeptide (TPR) repeat protein